MLKLVFGAAHMAQYQSLTMDKHVVDLAQMFSYIKRHQRSRIVFDPTNPDFGYKGSVEADLS